MYDDLDFAPEYAEEEDELVQDWTDPDFAPDLSTEDQLFIGEQMHRGWPPEGVTRPYQRGIIDSPEYWMGDVMQGQGHGRPNLQEWDNRVGSQTDTGPSVRPLDQRASLTEPDPFMPTQLAQANEGVIGPNGIYSPIWPRGSGPNPNSPYRPNHSSPEYAPWYNDHIERYGAPPNLPPPRKEGEDEPKGETQDDRVAMLTPPYGTRREPSVNPVAQDPRDINQFIRQSLQQQDYANMPSEARDVHEQIDMIRGAAPRMRPQDIQQFLEEQMRGQGYMLPPRPEDAIPPEYEEDVFRGRRFG